MRIAHVTATFPPQYTGTGIVCYYNALGLARLGHQVTVFTVAHPSGDYVYPKGIVVRCLPPLFRIGNAPFLPELLHLRGFDVVHLHYPFYFGSEIVFFKALTDNLNYVVTYHQDVLFPGVLRFVAELHHRVLGQLILTKAQKVLATSWDYAQFSRLRKLIQKNPGLVGVLPNGVDTQRFRPGIAGNALREKYGFDDKSAVLLFVGALDRAHYFKGVEILIRALSYLPDQRAKLLIVGDGDLRPVYQKKAIKMGLSGRVFFCGRVPDEELPAYYNICDILILPSITMGEAFGVVLLEAMACGKPVIASNLPGVRSVVSDGEDGLLARPGDVRDLAEKIQMLLDDPQRRREMGERGRAKVEEKYAWPRIIPRLVQVYEEVLADAGANR